MKLAILLIPAAFLIISYRKSKSISDPYVAFNALWVAVAALISAGNKYVYEPIGTALTCVLVGIIGFNLSMFTPKLILGKRGLGIFRCDDYYIDYLNVVIRRFVGGRVLLLVPILQVSDSTWKKYIDRLQERLDICCGRNDLAGKWGVIA